MNIGFTGFPKTGSNIRGIVQQKVPKIIPLSHQELTEAQRKGAVAREIFEDLEHFSPPPNMRKELVNRGTALFEKSIAPYKRIFNYKA